MPDHCIVYNCPNRRGQRDGKKSFYRIPRVVTNLGEVFYERSRLRRTKWLEALKMDPEIVEKKRTMVCSDHFLSGNPSEPHDIDNIDWVPSLKLGSANNEQTNLLNKILTDNTSSTNCDFLTANQFKGTNGTLLTETGTPTTLATVGIINSLDKEEYLDYFVIDDRYTTKQQQQQRTTYDNPIISTSTINQNNIVNKKKRKREEILQIPLSSNQMQSQSQSTATTSTTNDYTNSSLFVHNKPTKLSKMSQTNLTLDEMNKLLNELHALRDENLLLKNNIMPEYS